MNVLPLILQFIHLLRDGGYKKTTIFHGNSLRSYHNKITITTMCSSGKSKHCDAEDYTLEIDEQTNQRKQNRVLPAYWPKLKIWANKLKDKAAITGGNMLITAVSLSKEQKSEF